MNACSLPGSGPGMPPVFFLLILAVALAVGDAIRVVGGGRVWLWSPCSPTASQGSVICK